MRTFAFIDASNIIYGTRDEGKKELVVIANGSRTAREMKQLVGERFTDLKSLKRILEYKE